jgi:hypothetical protein
MTYMRNWKSHQLAHIHDKALIHKLGDFSQKLSCHWFIKKKYAFEGRKGENKP